jgi:hypothetical protein
VLYVEAPGLGNVPATTESARWIRKEIRLLLETRHSPGLAS